MLIYIYNPQAGEYVGSSEARESPLEPGAYLVPAHATATAPPDAQQGYVRVWNGSAWEQVEDHRGETVYSTATGEAVPITEPGPVPAGVTTTAPAVPFPTWDAETGTWTTDTDALAATKRAERNRKLAASDWTQLPDSPLSEEKKQEWALSYRQPLRNVPQQEGFPNNVTWPAEPAD